MWNELLPWSGPIVGILAIIHSIYATRSKAAAHKVSSIEVRVDKVEDRMTRVEGEMKHLPNKDTQHSIELRVEELSGKIGELTERLKPVTAMAERIQEAMIEQVRFK